MGLFGRLLVVFLAVGIVPVGVTGAWFLRTTGRAEENARFLHEQLTALAASTVEDTVGRLNRGLSFVEDLERLGSKAPEKEFAILQRAASATPPFILLSTLSLDGKERVRLADVAVFKSPELVDRSGEDLVKRAQSTGRLVLDEPAIIEGRPALVFAYPLLDGRLLYGAFDLAPLWKRLGALKPGRAGRVVVLGADGRPLKGSAEGFLPPTWRPPVRLGEASGWLADIPAPSGRMVGAYSGATSGDWRVMSLQPRAEALSVGTEFAGRAAAFMGLLVGLVAILAAWFAARLTDPIGALLAGAERAADNDLSTPVPELAWGELKRLAVAFNTMIGRLREVQDLHIERTLEEKSRVDALVRTIPDGIVLAGFDGRITFTNASAAEMLGGTEGTELSVHRALPAGPLRDLALAMLGRKREAGNAEFELRATAGTEPRQVAARGIVVRAERREVGILLILRDVTYEKEVERTKQNILETVTHDLRSPLASISGMAELMLMAGQATGDNALGEKHRKRATVITHAARTLSHLVDDILDVSKFESGMMTLDYKPAPLFPVLEAVHGLLSVQAAKEEVQLRLEAAPDLPPLEMDASQVQRVVQNLISNALKFTPSKGTVSVCAKRDHDGVLVQVRDTGAGIPADKVGKLFQKFFQVEETKVNAKARGTGLGLTVCRMVVETHGGRIWVESEFGKGSVFQFWLPEKQAKRDAKPAKPA
ncbi:MAG: HAMP domain-containing protein [Elusimicrobia bacterium]|nr:HAMP domain-containing protein [Elusimicrobiota bacterium]